MSEDKSVSVPTLQKAKPRISVQINATWQGPDSPTLQAMPRFGRFPASEDAPYQRPGLTVGPEWSKVDCGWVEDVGLLIVENLPTRFGVRPSKAEQDEADAKMLEISFNGEEGNDVRADLLLPPGEAILLTPTRARSIGIRCARGHTKVTITVFPK